MQHTWGGSWRCAKPASSAPSGGWTGLRSTFRRRFSASQLSAFSPDNEGLRHGVPTTTEALDPHALYVRCMFHPFFYGPFPDEDALVAALRTLDKEDPMWDYDCFCIHRGDPACTNRATRCGDGAVAQPLGGRDVRRLQERLACRRVSQLPDLTPIDFALFTQAMPAASSGARRPLSVAATASARGDARRAEGPASMICRRAASRTNTPWLAIPARPPKPPEAAANRRSTAAASWRPRMPPCSTVSWLCSKSS
jgi:hypothetical protein